MNHNHANGETLPYREVNPVPSIKRREYYCYNKRFLETDFKGYFVSDDGVVLSFLPKNGKGKIDYNREPRQLKYGNTGSNRKYYNVFLSNNGKVKPILVHRLVYETFIGKIPQNLTIDHIDNNSHNNSLGNLQILSREDNARKARKNKKVVSRRKVVYLKLDNTVFTFLSVTDFIDAKLLDYEIITRGRNKQYDSKHSKYKILSFNEGVTTIEIEVETKSQRVE